MLEMKRHMVYGALMLVLFIFTGCAYGLRITNEDDFNPAGGFTREPVNVGFRPTEDRLLNSVMEEMALSTGVREVKKNYGPGNTGADYVIALDKEMSFRSSGDNFSIALPGFFVFAHAWVGYKYYVDITTHSRLMSPNGTVLDEATVLTPYEIRYTSFARGAASSMVGWLTTGYGLFQIIPAVIFSVSYDERATREFLYRAEPSYKRYVSGKVLEQIFSVRDRDRSPGEAGQTRRMDTVVIGEGEPSRAQGEADKNRYATYVLKVVDGGAVLVSMIEVELSEDALEMLRGLARGGVTGREDVVSVFGALGVSDVHLPENAAGIRPYTMRGEGLVELPVTPEAEGGYRVVENFTPSGVFTRPAPRY